MVRERREVGGRRSDVRVQSSVFSAAQTKLPQKHFAFMERYKGQDDHNSGVRGYELLPEGIKLQFQDYSTYLYDYEKPGRHEVEEMKRLAKSGSGLTTYVNQHVRENYKRKL